MKKIQSCESSIHALIPIIQQSVSWIHECLVNVCVQHSCQGTDEPESENIF